MCRGKTVEVGLEKSVEEEYKSEGVDMTGVQEEAFSGKEAGEGIKGKRIYGKVKKIHLH